MPLLEGILEPIPGESPSGTDLHNSRVYDELKEARREDDGLPQGDWVQERKVADHRLVIDLTQETLATKTKDLWLAAWLLESLVVTRGFGGLKEGISLVDGLVRGFWDTLFPQLEDGDAEQRVAPLEWLGPRLSIKIKRNACCRDDYSFFQYEESRSILPEDQATTKDQKAHREAALKEGKIAPEIIDKALKETPKAFYAEADKELGASLAGLTRLDELCREKFESLAPSFEKLKLSIGDVHRIVRKTLDKKRETEPDPIEATPPSTTVARPESESIQVASTSPGSGEPEAPSSNATIAFRPIEEPGDRGAAVAGVAAAASFLRRREPYSPAPYLMLRGLRWGELRASQDPAVLEAAPTEIRRQIKALAMDNRWTELLEAGENAMALPCGRAWLDLQRFSVEACVALGKDYDAIAIAIRSELRALLRDLPQLLDATLSDDTPAANAGTQAWLRELLAEPAVTAVVSNLPELSVSDTTRDSGWQKKFVDSHTLAGEAMRQGKPQRAFEIMHEEIARQRSGRGRFQRRMQLAEMCVAAGKEAIAQPLLDDVAAAIETHKLEDWEDPQLVAGALAFLIHASKKIQADAKLKQSMFERICRLDPVQALSV